MSQLLSEKIARIARIGMGAAVLGYGLYIAEPGAPRLMIFGLALFALPLLFQFLPWPLARAYALWFGVFLVLQSLMAPILLGDAAYLVLHRPNVRMTLTFAEGALPGITGTQRVTFDERGFRVQPPVSYDRKTGVRIFAIGGSTTEELFVDDAATWTHRLQVALATDLGRPVEVINAGVSGLRARHHVAMLRHILPLQPDLVLFLVGFNDWHFDTISLFGSDRSRQRQLFSDTPLGRLARVQFNRVFRPATGDATAESRVVTRESFRRGSLRREQKISWFPERASDRYLANLATISRVCRANSLTCVFLTQPTAYAQNAPQELKDLFWMSPVDASYTLQLDSLVHIARVYNRALVDFVKQRGHPLCNVAEQLQPTVENFNDELHFTLAGSARMAEFVTGCVKPLVAAMPSSL
jgi:lysophospholipase L1-like esterase